MSDVPHDTLPPTAPQWSGFTSDRWSLTRDEDGALLIRDGVHHTSLGVGSRNDLLELANLLLIGADVIDGAPFAESTIRVDFVTDTSADVAFSVFGQPPMLGETVCLPDGMVATVHHVRRDYQRNGPSKVTVSVRPASAA